MRQSITTARSAPDWMNEEHHRDAELALDRVPTESAWLTRLTHDRREVLERCLARIASAGRPPRVCLYLLAAHGYEPVRSRVAARNYARQQKWQSRTLQVFTDRVGATDPFLRPGWSKVRRQIRGGFVDGVVALTHSAISPHLDEYELQLTLVGRHGGFVALVTPEATGKQP